MALNDDLQACGLAPTGEPPSVTVDLAGFAIGVTYLSADGRVTVEARASGAAPDGDALTAATLAGAGDTRVEGQGDLPFPVQRFAAAGHLPVAVQRPGQALGDIPGMGGDAAGDDPFAQSFTTGFGIVARRETA